MNVNKLIPKSQNSVLSKENRFNPKSENSVLSKEHPTFLSPTTTRDSPKAPPATDFETLSHLQHVTTITPTWHGPCMRYVLAPSLHGHAGMLE